MDLEKAIAVLRAYQRHHLLREYDDAGQILVENVSVSDAIDRIIEAAEKK